jgi:uncharacterized protein (TIGR03118 family)
VSLFLLLSASRPAAAQFYAQHNLVSDGFVPADVTDPDLVNAWGLTASPTSPWWVADNASNKSPTGIVFNNTNSFLLNGTKARFIFAGEEGTILAWNGGTQASVVATTPDAVYKGLAIGSTTEGDFLYATNFRSGKVDVFDGNFSPVSENLFEDPSIPQGYAPFGIQNIGGMVFVTYALQDADKKDDVPGMGHGYVNAFDTAGNLLGRVASKGPLNSPWGLALAPDEFGKFGGDLLVGNFGDGRIHAFDPTKLNGQGEFQHRGPLHSAGGPPLEIEGLWALQFGNGANAGPRDTLFFTAGPGDEEHGLFGKIEAVAPPGLQR